MLRPRVRVLRIITRLNMGGPAHQAALLSGRRLNPDVYETLLVHGRLAPGDESMADLAEREGAQMRFVPSLAQPVSPTRDARALVQLARLLRRFRPHIVHTHMAQAGFIGRLATWVSQPRPPVVVHTYHGHVLEGYFGPLRSGAYRRLERLLGRGSDCLIGVSQATVDDLVRLGVAPRERFRVIPLGLDLEPFTGVSREQGATIRRELGIPKEEIVLLYAGRVVPIKRLDLLIRALARLRQNQPRVRLVIVGDGEVRADLEALAARLGVADAASFLGYRRDMPSLAAAADLAVLSSANEGTPVSLIEAAAAGLPAVAPDVGGVPELVTPECGLLVPPGDDQALARAIARLAAAPELRAAMGDRAREHVLESRSIDRLVGDIDGLYRELLADRAPAPPLND